MASTISIPDLGFFVNMSTTKKQRSPLGTPPACLAHLSAKISPAISPKTSIATFKYYEFRFCQSTVTKCILNRQLKISLSCKATVLFFVIIILRFLRGLSYLQNEDYENLLAKNLSWSFIAPTEKANAKNVKMPRSNIGE